MPFAVIVDDETVVAPFACEAACLLWTRAHLRDGEKYRVRKFTKPTAWKGVNK